MQTATTKTFAERLGLRLGGLWRRVIRLEASLIYRLSGNETGTRSAKILLGTAKAILLMILLYVSIWVAVMVAVILVASTLSTRSFMMSPSQTELRDGHSGVGVYDQNDWRIDPADIDDM